MMHVVRLIAATIAGVMVWAFVMAHDTMMISMVFPCDWSMDRLSILPSLTVWVVHLDAYWIIVPGAVLAGGLWALRRDHRTGFEFAVAAGWLSSLCWLLMALLVWYLPMLPLCSPILE